ncbi:hypothetical protein CHLNCDRAFT_58343 [Chlorella variabilis]|uniref:Uncharacterized protein n=1 Tax=Chlorella variabilis TaxID=554065 RepID=E1ZJC9_CHLVA|nr:hypothetical protein CHLNCDRAFT_58343 [Chlorella variabilis]EFN53972.1 hypothetical protein CHLNCDRAFT_58343 [Chlorella variabilis]|eukprot:XP_005846074.1 hypothetical protein CHLNCDRAFT_58343 [Chlorella variabilis]
MELAGQLSQAAGDGDEAAVRQLLAAGARADQGDQHGWLPLHVASIFGHERVVRLLLEAAPATALAVDLFESTPLHLAAELGKVGVIQLLLSAAPAAASMLNAETHSPIYYAACRSNAAVVQQLLEAAPAMAFALDAFGHTPLHWALRYSHFNGTAEQVMETACCLVQAALAVQPALGILLQYSQRSATLFTDLVARLPLSQEQWHSIPAPCSDLGRALPAVLERSTAEAGWLVRRLAKGQRKRLRAAALSLARAQRGLPSLPAELSGRILAVCLLEP